MTNSLLEWHPVAGERVRLWIGSGRARRKVDGVVKKSSAGWTWDQLGRCAVELPGLYGEEPHWVFCRAEELEPVEK